MLAYLLVSVPLLATTLALECYKGFDEYGLNLHECTSSELGQSPFCFTLSVIDDDKQQTDRGCGLLTCQETGCETIVGQRAVYKYCCCDSDFCNDNPIPTDHAAYTTVAPARATSAPTPVPPVLPRTNYPSPVKETTTTTASASGIAGAIVLLLPVLATLLH